MRYAKQFAGVLALVMCLTLTASAQDTSRVVVDIPDATGVAIDPSPLDYAAVKDVYGGRIAARYWAFQLDIENFDERPYWLRGVSFGLSPAQCDEAKSLYPSFNVTRCREMYYRLVKYPAANAPVDQRLLIAVSRMGAMQSKRAQIFRLLEFGLTLGTVATPYLNVTQAAGLATFSSVGMPALQKLFPDFSGQQLQSLADMSYRQGIIVGPKQSESLIVFIPSDRMFSKDNWSMYTASAQKQSQEALEMKQFLTMVLTVTTRGNWITTTPAEDATSNGIRR